MADRKQSQEQPQEFLGGGPKFNSVGKDTRGADEPPVEVQRTGLGRILLIAAIIVLLAGGLIYLNQQNLGRTVTPPSRGGGGVAPGDKAAPSTDPNFK